MEKSLLLASLLTFLFSLSSYAFAVTPMVASGGYHTVALKNDGTVWTWGGNEYGQLGDGTTTDRLTAVKVSGMTDVQAIVAGDIHTVALKNDGTVWTWGGNEYGQLGDGTTTDRLTAVKVSGMTDVQAIVAGDIYTVALKDDSTVWTWGYNNSDQLGDSAGLLQIQSLTITTDNCPTDPNKIDPGICGCGIADTDSDDDGTPDCKDNCQFISNSNQVDTDGDDVGDCCDYSSIDPCEIGLKLQSYEPNTILARNDSNNSGEWYLDFIFSQMYPMFNDGCQKPASGNWFWILPKGRLYFAATIRASFYVFGDRSSSPVIGERFNPILFSRWWLGGEDPYGYFDLGYAHESNGQSISTEEEYLSKRYSFIKKGENGDYADDFLSRGWDYLDVGYTYIINKGKEDVASEINLKFKYFLDYGLLQKGAEEAYSWKESKEYKRSEYDGLTVKYMTRAFKPYTDWGVKFGLKYTTGYNDIFKHNTLGIKGVVASPILPSLVIWFNTGYNSDLSVYYKNVTTWGVGFEMPNFLRDLF